MFEGEHVENVGTTPRRSSTRLCPAYEGERNLLKMNSHQHLGMKSGQQW